MSRCREPHRERRHAALLTLVAALATVAACGGGGGNTDPPPPPPPPTGPNFSAYTLERTGASIDVTVVTEAVRAASALIGTEGGSLTATAADGSTYRLDIPADALAAPTVITLTPAAASGLPIGGGSTLAGLQLEPNGMVFANPVRLTITPATAVALDRQILVQWPNDGTGVGFAAPDPAQSGLQILLMHFSGVGLLRAATSFDDDVAAVRTRIGGTSTLRLESAAAEIAMRERLNRHASIANAEGPVVRNTLTGTLLGQYQTQVLDVRSAAAQGPGANCGTVGQAVETLTQFQRLRNGLGIADADAALAAGATTLMPLLAEACQKVEFETCRDSGTVHRIQPARTALRRQATLLGAAASSTEGADRYVAGCLRFRFDFDSTAGADTTPYKFAERMQAGNVLLQWSAADDKITGSGTLAPVSFTYVPNVACPGVSNIVQRGSDLAVNALELRRDAAGNLTDLALQLLPGATGTTFNSCVDPNVVEALDGITWSTAWLLAIPTVAETLPGGFSITGWTLGGSSFARRAIDAPLVGPDATFGATDTLTLRHEPQL
jgi:hypothetical protein